MARDIYEDTDAADAEQPGEGLANGLVILTTLLLLGAFLVMEMALKKHFNSGFLADQAQGGTTTTGTP
jgi:hypothetical protein